MDEHYFMNVIRTLGQKIDTLEYMVQEHKREAEKLSEDNLKLRMLIAEMERSNG